ncbi:MULTISPECIES: glycine betaine ABC transporter substrate-binding protein [unclassified Curtobacterium]|uniref:glycine betaine ABC transporter substrate-binding protein n=1 Tax=unclassified Curtobacterium TaxID=257496 RepID=UPI000DA7F809|nr:MULTISPECIES: glycine betaine ABC transporter substrate-binding protein [unclassified Curtobacterium]PZE37570.1 glycine/betaine ABC transporter substrate-binding protein [Curtobacterium sp. MCPF17_031]PZE58820.1 glycine/betaine ABC transporter substrate-binding protein [Curtobacterium sp. MCPF17_001]PZF15450.1 glycine/betaine ABC transporter substrate-binding protein [Curtobacterium sp. MCPF17_011]
MTRRTRTPGRRARRLLAAAALAGVTTSLLAGCGLQPAASFVPAAAPGTIKHIDDLPEGAALTVTSKNFTEQLVLGKIAVLAASAAGFDVTDETNVPGSVAVRQLMTSHDADLTYEYTGTAWLTFMGHKKGIPDKTEQWQAVKDEDAGNGLTWLPPAPMNNTYAFAVRDEAVKDLDGITKLSQIADLPADERTFCVESEFNSRADGFKPMLEKYGLDLGGSGDNAIAKKNVDILDTGTVYTATDRGTCNFGEVFTTDGRIKSLGLTVLQDDRGFFPAYNVAPVLSSSALQEYPQLEGIYDQISPKLTDAVLQELNRQVDVEGREPADVAFEWMVKEGFITKP